MRRKKKWASRFLEKSAELRDDGQTPTSPSAISILTHRIFQLLKSNAFQWTKNDQKLFESDQFSLRKTESKWQICQINQVSSSESVSGSNRNTLIAYPFSQASGITLYIYSCALENRIRRRSYVNHTVHLQLILLTSEMTWPQGQTEFKQIDFTPFELISLDVT